MCLEETVSGVNRFAQVKAYKYKLKTSAKFEAARNIAIDVCGELYSAAMPVRRDALQINRISINYHAQAIQLPRIKRVRVVIKLNPSYTSQAYTSQGCPQRSHKARKTLATREHWCDYCGFVAHCDHNSALTVKGRAGLSGMISGRGVA
jgi:Putative transposase DNA-binding domain